MRGSGGQLVGGGADEPNEQRKPAVQLSHAVVPLSDVNVPGGHSSHVAWPECAAMLPGAQGRGSVAPAVHDEPEGQGRHSVADWSCVRLLYVPASQGSGADAPTGQ